MISELISGFLKPVTGIIDKMVMDKDKYAELQFKKLELEYTARSELLTITTTPSVDAVVKLLVTIKEVVIPLLRPVGSFGLAAFAAYAETNGISLPSEIQYMLYGSPVAWGASRHVNKQTQAKEKAKRQQPASRPAVDAWDPADDL